MKNKNGIDILDKPKKQYVKKFKNAISSQLRCHICDYGIPHDWHDRQSPLFGTVDHVIPKAAGGSNDARNLKPAHRLCNILKKDMRLNLPMKLAAQEAIATYVGLLGTIKLWDFELQKELEPMYRSIAIIWWEKKFGERLATETEAVNKVIGLLEQKIEALEVTNRINDTYAETFNKLNSNFLLHKNALLKIPYFIRWIFGVKEID